MKEKISENLKLIEEWHWEKNTPLGLFPDKITCGSDWSVWWKCKDCGHEWPATPGHRTNQKKPTNCPKCAANIRAKNRKNNLQAKSNISITHPELLKEWDFNKNEIRPENITKGSHINIWWKCKSGHSWPAPVGNRIKGHGCPYCSGRLPIKGVNDLLTKDPKLAKEWNYDKNKNLTPDMVTYSSNKEVWWKCKYGHEWLASIANRHKKRGCPECSKYRRISVPEKAIYYYLSQVFDIEENKKIKYQMELDLYIEKLNLGIEYDGRAWHKNVERDVKKDLFCKENNITLIRVREEGLPEIDSNAIIIKAKKLDSEMKYMQTVIEQLVSKINQLYSIQLKLDVNIERDYYKILSLIEKFNIDNSLAKQFPELLKEWNYARNGKLDPNKLAKGSSTRVWWICEKGHEWKAAINNRTNESNKNKCPYCQGKKTIVGVNDIVTLKCDFLKDWDYEKNKRPPNEFMKHSGIRVWWKCSECGYEWKTQIDARAKSKYGCKHCAQKQSWAKRARKVKNVDTNEIFNSVQEAAQVYSTTASLITRVCNGERKTSGGYHWAFLEQKEYIAGKNCRSVKNKDTGEIFASAREAAIKYETTSDMITRVCRGERNETKGYHWEYV